MLNRRNLLKYGLLGSGLLAIGGLGLQSTKLMKASQPLLVLSTVEFSILFAVANRLLPQNGGFPAASDLHIAERVDHILSKAHPDVQSEIKQVLHLIENALVGTILGGHIRPFSQCSSKTQDQILEQWKLSSLSLRRTAFKALNGLCGATYYADSKTYALLGYDGPPEHLLNLVRAAGER
jgi:hypothetical protein